MERFQDPERLAALFARCRIPERLPWTAAYPWTLQYYEKENTSAACGNP
ncbi:MAG: hypothetical protein ACLRIS_00825 [Flavonifractor plautii]